MTCSETSQPILLLKDDRAWYRVVLCGEALKRVRSIIVAKEGSASRASPLEYNVYIKLRVEVR